MTDRISHWLEGGALVVGLIGLYLISRNQTSGAVEQQAPAALPGPGTLQFGAATPAQIQPSGIILGGDPIYTTYNYPPAPSSGTGATATQGDSQQYYSNRQHNPGHQGCCCNDKKCAPQFGSIDSLGSNYSELIAAQAHNLMSLPYKGQQSY